MYGTFMSEGRERRGGRKMGWRRGAVAVLAGAFFLTAWLAGNAFCNSWPAHPASALGAADTAEAVPGELLVKFREPLEAAGRDQVHAAAASQELGRIDASRRIRGRSGPRRIGGGGGPALSAPNPMSSTPSLTTSSRRTSLRTIPSTPDGSSGTTTSSTPRRPGILRPAIRA